MTDIVIHKITVGKWHENTYLLEKDNQVLIIDPGDDYDVINNYIIAHEMRPLVIVNTHGHFDHIGAVQQLKDNYKIEFYIHSKDRRLVSQANLYRKLAGDNTIIQTPKIDQFLDDKEHLIIGGFKINIFYIPGHTDGSVAFGTGNSLFTGDLLFANATGRTDLPGGNALLIRKTIDEVLEKFKGATIYPGHGDVFEINNTYIEQIKKLG